MIIFALVLLSLYPIGFLIPLAAKTGKGLVIVNTTIILVALVMLWGAADTDWMATMIAMAFLMPIITGLLAGTVARTVSFARKIPVKSFRGLAVYSVCFLAMPFAYATYSVGQGVKQAMAFKARPSTDTLPQIASCEALRKIDDRLLTTTLKSLARNGTTVTSESHVVSYPSKFLAYGRPNNLKKAATYERLNLKMLLEDGRPVQRSQRDAQGRRITQKDLPPEINFSLGGAIPMSAKAPRMSPEQSKDQPLVETLTVPSEIEGLREISDRADARAGRTFVKFTDGKPVHWVNCSARANTPGPHCEFRIDDSAVAIKGRFRAEYLKKWPKIMNYVSDFANCTAAAGNTASRTTP